MWKKFLKQQQGFTMIELLLALMVTSICTLLFVQLVRIMIVTSTKDYQVEDDLAIKQLQLLFAQGSNYNVTYDACSLLYHNEEITFEQYEDKLVRRNGFEIFLQDIDEISFAQEGGCVYATWSREEEQTKAVLGCE